MGYPDNPEERVSLMRNLAARHPLKLDRSSERRPGFDEVLLDHGLAPLVRGQITTLQVNVGKFCNMACRRGTPPPRKR